MDYHATGNTSSRTKQSTDTGDANKTNRYRRHYHYSLLAIGTVLLLSACTQEAQNKFGRAVQNWTGTDGRLEIYAGEKLVRQFVKIDKLTTAESTQGDSARPYRFGYGILDTNFNGKKDSGEKKVYFEFSDYSTSYIFYESP